MSVSEFSQMKADQLRGALVVAPPADMTGAQALRLLTHGTRRRIVFGHHMGGRRYDVIHSSFVAIRLIQERVAALLEPFSGWKLFRVQVYDRKGERIDGYFGLTVTGRVGPIDYSTERIVWHKPHGPGLPWFQVGKGYSLDEASWDGSDMCVPAETSLILVSPAVRQALIEAKVRPVVFTPIHEAERHWNWRGLPKLAFSDSPPHDDPEPTP